MLDDVLVAGGSSPHTRGARTSRPGVWGGGLDHPRIRGEHRRHRLSLIPHEGSSPHTRGAHRPARSRGHHKRIIPAYAGSTAARRSSSTAISDHPRIRGEHAIPRLRLVEVQGSSPHTRGARAGTPQEFTVKRIIPAYAGSTASCCALMLFAVGSSPHTRGAPRRRERHRRYSGIIPAYAGSTMSTPVMVVHMTDHPRIRGEHERVVEFLGGEQGSSPHTRGARFPFFARGAFPRIIPAYAGSTPGRRWCGPPQTDHPRIRGEHSSAPGCGTDPWGSSPHTRGAQVARVLAVVYGGIIPAYAGSTSSK